VADPGSYHAILGQPCYTKFVAIPNYRYLKLKIPVPKGVITVGGSLQHAHLCERESCDLPAPVVRSLEF
jgi:hypothetical protein